MRLLNKYDNKLRNVLVHVKANNGKIVCLLNESYVAINLFSEEYTLSYSKWIPHFFQKIMINAGNVTKLSTYTLFHARVVLKSQEVKKVNTNITENRFKRTVSNSEFLNSTCTMSLIDLVCTFITSCNIFLF